MNDGAARIFPTAINEDGSRRNAQFWATWFWNEFFMDWLSKVQDGEDGVFDALEVDGTPDTSGGKSLLAQARTLFTISHAALLTKNPKLISAARQQAAFLTRFEKSPGLYRCVASRDGKPTGSEADEIARSYDQTFIILALSTWNRIEPSEENEQRIEDCWAALQSHLLNPATGLLYNDDTHSDTPPAQNPHMHLYEACLQAYRMTDKELWLTRAGSLRETALQNFMDQSSGSIAEFLTVDLKPLPGADGLRREPGHQCEWAWLLLEEAQLSNTPSLGDTAERLTKFADAYGFVDDGSLKGAAYDAVSADGDVVEKTILLWPQTEVIKVLALRYLAGDQQSGDRARDLLCVMFENWFADRPSYVNQLDLDGNTVWPQALTRLMYHLIIAMTEGARVQLWSTPSAPTPSQQG
ncbi:MAG: AGE family epimerase/isomerase [Litoreibacter sp.]